MPEAGLGFLGVLMLATRFPRPPGDIGNPQTFRRVAIPVRYVVIEGATARHIVGADSDAALLPRFVDAALSLVRQGARLVSTSCGFLARHQSALSTAVPVPVLSSSLLQCRAVPAPGIVTFDLSALREDVLVGASVPAGTPVGAIKPGCELHRRILGDEAVLDEAQACRDVVAAAQALLREHPAVQTLVLECTNMPPYRHAVAAATGRQVVDIETMLIAAWRDIAPSDRPLAGRRDRHPTSKTQGD